MSLDSKVDKQDTSKQLYWLTKQAVLVLEAIVWKYSKITWKSLYLKVFNPVLFIMSNKEEWLNES